MIKSKLSKNVTINVWGDVLSIYNGRIFLFL